MLCLSELGELDKGIGGELQTTVQQWMSELLADSAVQPVSIDAGAHYLTIVKDEHEKSAQQKERSFRHLEVRPADCIVESS